MRPTWYSRPTSTQKCCQYHLPTIWHGSCGLWLAYCQSVSHACLWNCHDHISPLIASQDDQTRHWATDWRTILPIWVNHIAQRSIRNFWLHHCWPRRDMAIQFDDRLLYQTQYHGHQHFHQHHESMFYYKSLPWKTTEPTMIVASPLTYQYQRANHYYYYCTVRLFTKLGHEESKTENRFEEDQWTNCQFLVGISASREQRPAKRKWLKFWSKHVYYYKFNAL